MLYTVSQAAKLLDVTPRTLRYYDNIGLARPVSVKENRYRYYDDSDLERLRRILLFRSFGFSLQDIENMLLLSPESEEKLLTEQLGILQGKTTELIRMIRLTKIRLQEIQQKRKDETL